MGSIVYLSLGSNLGDRIENLQSALKKIASISGTITKVSGYYETEPWGFETDQEFLNICVSLKTDFPPLTLLDQFQKIESELGRQRSNQKGYASRTLDIDILTYDNICMQSERLTVPHTELENRNFVLLPLQEIAPDFTHPQTAKTIQQILASCIDETSVILYENK